MKPSYGNFNPPVLLSRILRWVGLAAEEEQPRVLEDAVRASRGDSSSGRGGQVVDH